MLLVLLAWVAVWFALALPFVVVRRLPSAILTVAGVIPLMFAFILLRRGRVRTAAWIFTVALWLWAGTMALLSGGIRSVSLIAFLPGFITSAILLGRRVALWSCVVFLGFALALAVMEMRGIHTPQYFPMPPMIIWMGAVITVFVVATPVDELLRFFKESVEIMQRQVDELRDTARSLRESETRYRAILESAPDGIVVADGRSGEILSCNPAAEQITGGRPEELRNLLLSEMQKRTARQGLIEAAITRTDGQTTPVELSLHIAEGEEGRRLIAAVFRDISERKMAEQERAKLEERVRLAQKLEIVGRLAGGVAHDFNNLLTVINGFSQVVLARLAAEDQNRAAIEEIRKAGERAAGLTRQLLAFSRKQMVRVTPMNLNSVVLELLPMLRSMLRIDIDLTPRLGADLPAIEADASQIQQIVMNLVTNARDAMPAGGRLTIETGAVEWHEQNTEPGTNLAAGNYVMLAVTDSGVGIDDEVRAHLFEPFFTTKEVGKGTGLGLSTVYGIVQQAGGAVTVASKPGQGSTFKVYLPARTVRTVEPEGAAPATQEAETILVVEDQDNVRKLIVQILTTNGYRVLQAANGIEALEEAERHPGILPLMITDVVMPGMAGPELAERLLTLRPETKVIFTSGYAESGVGLAAGGAYIPKPFTPAGLVAKVRQVLGRTAAAGGKGLSAGGGE